MLCDRYTSAIPEAYEAGALGSVLLNFYNDDDLSLILPLAATALHPKEYSVMMSYMNSTRYSFFSIS